MLTPAENNSNCGGVGGGAFETSGACGGVRILGNDNIISRGGKKYFQKEQNWKVVRVRSCVLLGLKLTFQSRYGLFQMQG